MQMTGYFGFAFWGFLAFYGMAMYALSPAARDRNGFFLGTDTAGRAASRFSLTASIFISWIFAKSVTNAANLGAEYGVVGGLAYATYWLSIPLAGWVIYRLRTREGARGLVEFLMRKYGRLAGLAFSAAILIRLYNEVWSNTAVVGGYYGQPGSAGYIGAALLFTAATLFYSIKGGLRSSIHTDVIQAGIFVVFLALVMAAVLPRHGAAELLASGSFRLDAGVDLLLVAGLQILSYPFHDPVLTDRGFITEEKAMLRAFVLAGILGFACILIFSLVGVDAKLSGIPVSGNVPAAVAHSFGIAALLVMTVVMVVSAGSTLDSTFSSLAKSVAHELPMLAGRREPGAAVAIGTAAMIVLAIAGNLPMLFGTDILKATTISGTMVIGLAPVFLLHRWVERSPLAFHLSFWSGIVLGGALAAGMIPASWGIGNGKFAVLLGTNLYGLLWCTAVFLAPGALARTARIRR